VSAAFFAAAERLDAVRLRAAFFVARLAVAFFVAGARFFVGAFFVDVFFEALFFPAAVLLEAPAPLAPPVCLFTVAQARFCAVFFDTPRFS
jgi:hypothetical protein